MNDLFAKRIFWFLNISLGIGKNISITAIKIFMESDLCNEEKIFHCINMLSTSVKKGTENLENLC